MSDNSGHLRNFNSKTRPPIKRYRFSFRLSTLRSIHTSKIDVFHRKLTMLQPFIFGKGWNFQYLQINMVVTLVNLQSNTSILLVWIDLSVLSIKEQLYPLIGGRVFELKLRKWPELSDIFYCGLFARKSTLRSLAQF